MTRDEVIAELRAQRADLQAMNVTSVASFGSVACDEAGPDSDVDILIEHKRGLTLLDPGRIRNMPDAWIGRKVDLYQTGLAPGHPAPGSRRGRGCLDVIGASA